MFYYVIFISLLTSILIGVIFFSFMDRVFQRSYDFQYWKCCIPMTCYLFIFKIVGYTIANDIVISTIALLLYMFILLKWLYFSDYKNIYLYTFLFVICLLSVEAILNVFFDMLENLIYMSRNDRMMMASICSIVFDFIVYYGFVRKLSKKTAIYQGNYIEYLILIFGFVDVITFTSFIHYSDSLYEKLMAFCFCLIIIICDISLLFFIHKIALEQEKTKALAIENIRLHSEVSCFQAQKKCYENQQQMMHDIKHHLNVLHNLGQQDMKKQIEQYRHDIMKHIEQYPYYTKDHVLQILLINLKKACEEKDITFKCKINDNDELLEGMSEFNKVSIFSNLFTNAFEAVMQSYTKESYIKVNIQPMNAGLCVQVKNTFNFELNKKGNVFYSSKKDHLGIGLRNIEKIIKNCKGIMSINSDHHIFNVVIYLPMGKLCKNI